MKVRIERAAVESGVSARHLYRLARAGPITLYKSAAERHTLVDTDELAEAPKPRPKARKKCGDSRETLFA